MDEFRCAVAPIGVREGLIFVATGPHHNFAGFEHYQRRRFRDYQLAFRFLAGEGKGFWHRQIIDNARRSRCLRR